MKKVFVVAVVLSGLVVMAKRLGSRMHGMDWEKWFDRMPENAPPKWMARNITEIRRDTRRIRYLLEHERRGTGEPGGGATAA